MESLCSFEPLWKLTDVFSAPREAINDIRVKSLNFYLKKHKREHPRPLSVGDKYGIVWLALDHWLTKVLPIDAISECIDVIEFLLQDPNDGNEILQRLRAISHDQQCDAIRIVRGALAIWYTSAVPAIIRDPLQGLDPESPSDDEDGEEFDPWSREYASKRHAAANLGIMAMLMTSERWLAPVHPLMKAGSLVSRSVITVLYAAFLIAPRMVMVSWTQHLERTRPEEAVRLFLRSVWSLAREDYDLFDSMPPGIEFGATLDEVKLSSDGMDLITRIGHSTWYSPPVWHPIRKVPGSPWNKFLRNHSQPIFPESRSQAPGFRVMVPSSLHTLAQPYQTYYAELRSRMDQTGRSRLQISHDAKIEQFRALAEATGQYYPNMELSEDNATFTEDPDQEYLFKLPMIKKPITDMHGHLTLPFMNTAVRALRFREEPDEVEPDFHVMSFDL